MIVSEGIPERTGIVTAKRLGWDERLTPEQEFDLDPFDHEDADLRGELVRRDVPSTTFYPAFEVCTVGGQEADPKTVKDVTNEEGAEVNNAFCPTGSGGGIDPSCSPGGSSGRSVADLEASVKEHYEKLYGSGPDRLIKAKDRKAAKEAFDRDKAELDALRGKGSPVSEAKRAAAPESVKASPAEYGHGTVGSSPGQEAQAIRSDVKLTSPASFVPPPEEHLRTTLSTFDRIDRARGGFNFVNLVDLRREMSGAGVSREHQDRAIQHLRAKGILTASGAEGRHGISIEEREAAIREQGFGDLLPRTLLYLSRVK